MRSLFTSRLLKQFLLVSLDFSFTLLLPAHVLADPLFVQPDRADTVAARPQVPPPVLPPEPLIPLEYSHRQLPFQISHHLTDRILRRNPTDQVDMIFLHVQFKDFDAFLLPQQAIDLLVCILPYRVLKYPIPILWTKHHMILTLIQCVREFAKSLARSCTSLVWLPPSREVHLNYSDGITFPQTTTKGSGFLKTMKEIVKPEQFYTVEEYLAFERDSDFKHEYVSGVIVAMAGASRAHNLITGNVAREFGDQLKGKPCETYSNDMRVRTTPTEYTYPDVVAVCGEPQFEDEFVDTLLNPVLLVEILSKSTARYDRTSKFSDYRSIPSFAEYLLVAQDEYRVEQNAKQSDGRWLLTDFRSLEDVIELDSIQCSLSLKEIYDKVSLTRP